MLCSYTTDLIGVDGKCSECLQRTSSEWKNKKKSGASRVTLFCFREFARSFASSAPI